MTKWIPVLLSILLVSPASGKSPQECIPCEPEPEIKTAIQRALNNQDKGLAAKERIREQLEALQGLLKRFPDDFFIRRKFALLLHQSGNSGSSGWGVVNTSEDSAVGKYFWGLCQSQRDPDLSRDLFEEALNLEPSFVWPHLELAGYYYSYPSRDYEKAGDHLRLFLEACPNTLQAYRLVPRVFIEKEDLSKYGAGLRTLLEEKSAEEAISYYPDLWAIEFTVSPLSRYDEERMRVKGDVGRLKELEYSSPTVFSEAYKILDDEEGLSRTQARIDELRRQQQGESYLFREEHNKWFKENPSPPRQASIEDRQAFSRKLFDKTEEWVFDFPAMYLPWSVRLRAISGMFQAGLEEEVDAPELIRVAEKVMELGTPPDDVPGDTMIIAVLLMRKNINSGITEVALQRALDQVQQELPSFASPNNETFQWFGLVRVQTMIAELNLKKGEYEKAEERLDSVEELLTLHRDDCPPEYHFFESGVAGTQELRADLALARGEKLDALLCLQKSLSCYEKLPDAKPYQKKKTELAARIEEIVLDLGGTPEKWEELNLATESIKPPEPEAAGYSKQIKLGKDTPHSAITKVEMPPFEMVDLSGRTWTRSDFDGKVTLVNVWFTSCGPCIAELPYIQVLYEKLASEKSLQLVTFNIDDNPAIVQGFMKKREYTFPAVLAREVVAGIDFRPSYPQIWLVADGVIELWPGRIGPVLEPIISMMRERMPKQ